MIRFIMGRPGEGKSFVATHTMNRHIVQTKLEVVTNLPLIPGPLWFYLKQHHGIDLDTARITTLNDEQVKQFYRYRGRGWATDKPVERKQGGDGRIDFARLRRTVEVEPGVVKEEIASAKDLPSVLYIIDEAHNHFSSRHFAETADSALFYLSQHRHLGDEVFLITQNVKQVDVAFRRLAGEFWRITNVGNRFPFGVKLPDYFVVDVFNTEPGLLTPVQDVRKLKLDIEGLGACYDTAGGAGMVGGLADTATKRKGIPWQAVVGVFLLAVVGFFFVPNLVGKTIASAAGVTQPTNAAPAVAIAPAPTPAPSPAPPLKPFNPATFTAPAPVALATNTAQVRHVAFGPAVEPVRIKWMIRKESSVSLGLSNGDNYTVGDGRLQVMGHFAVLDGNKVFRLPE